MRRSWLRLVLAVLATVVLLELGVRVLDVGPRAYRERRVEPEGYSPFGRARSGLLVYRPGAEWSFVYDPAGDPRGYLGAQGRVSFRTNALGLRGPERELAKPQGALRVLCLGDSFTFGEGVRYEDAYPAVLERGLGEAHPDRRVEVWNAGVQAYGTFEAVELLASRLLAARPDVVVLGFFLNDATGFETTIAQFDERIRSTPASWPARASRLWGNVERTRAARRRHDVYVRTTRASFEGEGWKRCQHALKVLSGLAEERGFRLVVVVFPVLEELDGAYPFELEHERIGSFLSELDCETVDLLDVYRGRHAPDLWVHATDPHPNDVAHALAADRILELLVD